MYKSVWLKFVIVLHTKILYSLEYSALVKWTTYVILYILLFWSLAV